MSNFIIKNEMSSMLDLSAIKDIHGNPVSLRPSGGPGASREITEQASQHDAVTRVVGAKWASLTSVTTDVAAPFVPPPPVPAPAPDVVLAASGMAPVAVEPAAEPAAVEPAAEPAAVEPAAEPAAVEPAAEPTESTSADAPPLSGRPSSRRSR